MRGIFFSRARFAYVIQKPISWIFAYQTYLDGDSGSPFPRWTHNENCAVWLPRKSCSQRHTAYGIYLLLNNNINKKYSIFNQFLLLFTAVVELP